jgi:hypothetical protein
MTRFRARLAKLAERLKSNEAQLAKARRRAKANRSRATKFHKRQIAFQKQADEEAAIGGDYASGPARLYSLYAAKAKRKAERAHDKAIYWRGRIKACVQKIEGLEARQEMLKSALTKWQKTHGVTIEDNKVVGGTPGQRWKVACLVSVANCSNGSRRNFYSQSGSWDIDHELVGGPEYGHRSDCSSTVTGWAKACGLPDPNGEDWHGGYTGTLVGQHNGWKQVSQHYMETSGKPGYIVYGPGVGHHVEAYLGPGTRTAGHGSSPVDFGVVALFGDSDYRCFALE